MDHMTPNYFGYLAYHIRSLHLTIEAALEKGLKEAQLSSVEYYVLIADWSKYRVELCALAAHANLTLQKTKEAVEKLSALGLVVKSRKLGTGAASYSLTKQGEGLRRQCQIRRQKSLEDVLKVAPVEDLETTISVLMTMQTRILERWF